MRILLLTLICASFAMAQEEDKSVAAWKELQAEYNQARAEYYEPYNEARRKGESYKLDPAGHPDRTFAPRYKAFAEKHAGTEGALLALTALLRTRTDTDWTLKALIRDHLESDGLANTVFALRSVGGPQANAAYGVIAARSPHARVRGLALLQLGKARMSDDPDGAKAALREVVAKYSDEVYLGDRKLGPAAEGAIFELEHLAVGMEAPEIVGEDLDGVPMKLSEFRGKVVLLDFWGDW